MKHPCSTLAAAMIVAFVAASPAMADTVTIDFEGLGHFQDAAPYLAGFGVLVTTEPGTMLVGADENLIYGGGVIDAPSGTMYVTQVGSPTNVPAFPPNTFTLQFATPLDSFGFTEAALLVPSINSPWTATAYDGTGAVLDSVSLGFNVSHPALPFTLTGPGIDHVTFVQTAPSYAAFFSGNFDDFVLTAPPVPEPSWVWLFGLATFGLARRRRARAR